MSAPPKDLSQAAPAWIGEHIGNYRLVRLLGKGGMGMVFEAVNDSIGSRAAIKILRAQVAGRSEVEARFFNEARAANAIQHPGIVRVFDSGFTTTGVAFLAMELLDGESLSARFARVQRFAVQEALRLGRQIASALMAAHRQNIIHRDLKPDNIMLVPEPELPGGERVKILDFGIAKFAESMARVPQNTASEMLMGTPTYMAPEQCRGAKRVSDRSDVYSLGVILYQLLAGQPPFVAGSVMELLAMQLTDPAPPLQEYLSTADPRIAALVHTMLDKQASRRPAMDAVHHQLQELESLPEPPEPAEESADSDELPTQKVRIMQLVDPPTAPMALINLLALSGRAHKATTPEGAIALPGHQARTVSSPPKETARQGLLTPQQKKLGTVVAIGAAVLLVATLGYVVYGRAPATPSVPPGTLASPAKVAAPPGLSAAPPKTTSVRAVTPAANEKSKTKSWSRLRSTHKSR